MYCKSREYSCRARDELFDASLILCLRVEWNGAERSESGPWTSRARKGSDGVVRSAVIGKISGWGRASCIFRWTLCSGHSVDVLLIRVWRDRGRQWVGCVGRRTVVVVFGIFVVTFERVRARLYRYGSKCLTQRSHPTYISSFGSPTSKDSLAGSAFPHMFSKPRL